VGIGIAKIIIIYAASKNFTMLAINITPWLVISILLLSLVVGVISGLFPARAAAKMNVVDALRKQ
jgi:ABC-type antimicrobial peptide transport system permease subunit